LSGADGVFVTITSSRSAVGPISKLRPMRLDPLNILFVQTCQFASRFIMRAQRPVDLGVKAWVSRCSVLVMNSVITTLRHHGSHPCKN
jgi:hypothetical protein